MKEKYLIMFNIGPVQSFIVQARKTRDLFGGSRILSQLVREVMDKLVQEGGRIVFPAIELGNSLPNRFIGEWEGEASGVMKLGEQLESYLRRQWVKIAEEVFKANRLQWRQYEEEQLLNHLEVYWLAIPAPDYAAGFSQLDRLMGARKNVRDFSQIISTSSNGFGETGRKCNLDGTYNALVVRPEHHRKNKEAQELPHSYSILPKEGLSAISFTKRNFLKKGFQSTADIAFGDSLYHLRLESPDLCDDIEFLHQINEQIWGEDSISPAIWKKYLEDLDPDFVAKLDYKSVREKWERIQDFAKSKKLRFTKYYAVLLFDGDSMGKWLSGDEEFVKKEIALEAFHNDFSKCLVDFAKKAEELVNKDDFRRGQCVYTGGDDFLGLINLNHLLPLLIELRLTFRQLVHLPLAEKYLQPYQELSFSAGICIASIKEPMRAVLNDSRRLEKMAKSRFKMLGKDSIAIGFVKGSGEIRETVWQQYLQDATSVQPKLTVSLFARVFQLLASDRFSEDFIRSLDLEMRTLGVPPEEIAQAEISRLVYRKYKPKPKESKEQKNQYCEELKELLLELYRQQPKQWDNLLSALYMCSFLKDKLNYQFYNASN